MFFSLAGSQVELRNDIFRALAARTVSLSNEQNVVFCDGVAVPDGCKTPIAHQLRIWASLDEWRLQLSELLESREQVIEVNGFGLDAAWRAARQTSCPVDRDHILQFQEQLVHLRIKAQGLLAPRYIVIVENSHDPAAAYAREYCARISNQHEPFFVFADMIRSTNHAVDIIAGFIGEHLIQEAYAA